MSYDPERFDVAIGYATWSLTVDLDDPTTVEVRSSPVGDPVARLTYHLDPDTGGVIDGRAGGMPVLDLPGWPSGTAEILLRYGHVMAAAASLARVVDNPNGPRALGDNAPAAVRAGTQWCVLWVGPDRVERYGFGPSPANARRSVARRAAYDLLAQDRAVRERQAEQAREQLYRDMQRRRRGD